MAKKKTAPARKKAPSVAVLAENIYEDLEAWYPILRLREAGVKVTVVGPEKGAIYASKHGYPLRADVSMKKARPGDFDGVVIPGGYAPDKMRRHKEMVNFVRAIHKKGGLVASICHGPWLMAEADILRGREVTCVSAIKTDLVNAGATYRNREVVVDGNLITSRTPPDLPAMMKAVLTFLGVQ